MKRQLSHFPRTQAGEVAVRSIAASRERPAPEMRAHRIRFADETVNPADSAVVEILSTVEAYIDTRVRLHIRRAMDDAISETSLKLIEDVENEVAKTWSARREGMSRYMGVAIAASPANPRILAAIEFRNCIVHGLGALTTQQRNKRGIVGAVKPIEVQVSGGRMYSSDNTLPIVQTAAIDLIRFIEESAPI